MENANLKIDVNSYYETIIKAEITDTQIWQSIHNLGLHVWFNGINYIESNDKIKLKQG